MARKDPLTRDDLAKAIEHYHREQGLGRLKNEQDVQRLIEKTVEGLPTNKIQGLTSFLKRLKDGFLDALHIFTTEEATNKYGDIYPIGNRSLEVDEQGNIQSGPNTLLTGALGGNHNGDIPDFLYDALSRRLFVRSLFLSEQADAADLALQRAAEPSTKTSGSHTLPTATINVDGTGDAFAASGELIVGSHTVTYTGKTSTTFTGCSGGSGVVPDDTQVSQPNYPDGPPVGIKAGTQLGTIYWRGWTTEGGDTPGLHTGGHFERRQAQIYCRAAEDLYNTAGGGELYFAVMPIGGGGDPEDALVIKSDKTIEVPKAMKVTGTSDSFLQFIEQGASPAAPATNEVKIYAKESASKTRLFARFATGAEVEIVAEP